jgi:hypothetical protein
MSAQPGKATTSAPERRHRRYPRFRAEFPVAITLFAGDEYHRLDAHCKDLSQAGIGVLLAAELAQGEVAALNFTLPGLPEPWQVRAVLRHRRGYHYGFEFLSLSAPQKDLLRNYLKSLKRADSDTPRQA